MTNIDAIGVIDTTVRTSYAKLLAFLSTRTRDIASAEDALSDALAAAMLQWPTEGAPPNPEAWLLTVARRRIIDANRRMDKESPISEALAMADTFAGCEAAFPDERLKILFACANPALDVSVRTPLMLQSVLGMTAERIASAFLVAPTTMGQRLSRAKKKTLEAGIRFEVPGPDELDERLEFVLESIYTAYSAGWDESFFGEDRNFGLAREAIWLGEMVVELLPASAETRGLLALMLFCESRRAARRTHEGAFVPLDQQDTAKWDAAMVHRARDIMGTPLDWLKVGRFQIEAMIQYVHAERLESGSTNWRTITLLYDFLVLASPTLGAYVGRAAAHARVFGPMNGLAALDELPKDMIDSYQPYWALYARLLYDAGEHIPADRARKRALDLTLDPAVREFLNKLGTNATVT